MPADDRAFQAGVDGLIVRLRAATERLATDGALIAQGHAMDRAPVRSGTLRRSLHTEPARSDGAGGFHAYMGPTVIYARRIELGFHGRDSIGRVYDQYGEPYVRPAFERARPEIMALARLRAASALRG